MSLIYGWIANLAAVILAVMAFNQARFKGQVAILVLMGAVFGFPGLWPSPTMSLVCFLAKIVIAIGCSIFVKWSTAT